VNRFMLKRPNREGGQGLVEYALILVLVAVVVIAILTALGPQVGNIFSRIVNTLQQGSAGPAPCHIVMAGGYAPDSTNVPPDILSRTSMSGSGFSWGGGSNNILTWNGYPGLATPKPDVALFSSKTWTVAVASATGNCSPFPNK
jgi:pilus assembly protein Flp/PilA